jgi:hypothetical protein
MPAQLALEAGASGFALAVHEALDGGAMLEDSWCPTGWARRSRGCGFHAPCIDPLLRSGDPWRE